MTNLNDGIKYCVSGIAKAERDVSKGDVQRTAA
jgi:hypothetical protein